jgi:hypothetical protein
MQLYSPDYNYSIYTTQKSGCSTIGLFFLILHYPEYHNSLLNSKMEKVLEQLYQCEKYTGLDNLHPELLQVVKKQDVEPHKDCFLVVRNPYARAVSMYVDKYIKTDRQDKWGRENLSKDLSFFHFLHEVKRLGGFLESNHFMTQFYFVMKKNNLNTEEIVQMPKVKIEDGDKAILNYYKKHIPELDQEKIIRALSLAKKVPNLTEFGEEEEGDASMINFYDKKLTHTRQSFLKKNTKTIIQQLYHEDFMVMGYKK